MVQNKALISIIIPVYQVEKYLEKCIQSVLKQTYQNFELILIDDGSEDKSGKICDKYAKKDLRIKVIHKENAGVSAARNYGIENATGEWLCFIDSDDYIERDYLSYLMDLCDKYSANISCCMYNVVYEKETIDTVVKIDKYNETTVYSSKEFVYLLLCDKVANYTWNKLFHVSLWENIRFNESLKIYEDSDTLYKVAAKAQKIVFGCESKYYYVQRKKSLLHSDQEIRNIIDFFPVLENQKHFVKEHKISTFRNVPFTLLKLENCRRYLNYCIEHKIDISVENIPYFNVLKNKIQIIMLLFYFDIFDIRSIVSNIVLLISLQLYIWQRKKR